MCSKSTTNRDDQPAFQNKSEKKVCLYFVSACKSSKIISRMTTPKFFENGELPDRVKREMISHFGLLMETSAHRISCPCNDYSKAYAARCSKDAFEPKHMGVTQEIVDSLRTLAAKVGVPIISTGVPIPKNQDSPDQQENLLNEAGNTVANVTMINMELCPDARCLHNLGAEFINKSFSILQSGVKALLVTCEALDWSEHGGRDSKLPLFQCTNFVSRLRYLVEDNYIPRYRDEKSRLERENAEMIAKAEKGEAIPLGAAAEPPQAATLEEACDPFHPLTKRQIWMKIPLNMRRSDGDQNYPSADLQNDVAWKWWSMTQHQIAINPKFCVCLELGAEVPSDPKKLDRWLGERLRCVIIPSSLWKRNKGGFPILPLPIKSFLLKTFHIPHMTYLVGFPEPDLLYNKSGEKTEKLLVELKNRFVYMLHLYKEYYRSRPNPDRDFAVRVYGDVPIRPLQPLRDHLTQEIYSVFENDRVKYELYNKAFYEVLKDFKMSGRCGTTDNPVIAMVVGAGRGPLVDEFIRAADTLEMSFKVYAVDKNPIAISAMVAKVDTTWANHAQHIQIIESDMRYFDPQDKADVLISELLGSFGCNELSPECLDGAQKLLKPDGVSIPCRYGSFLQPIMATTIHEDIASFAPGSQALLHDLALVELRSSVPIAPCQKAWEFVHPNFDAHTNGRQVTLTFTAEDSYRLTGFAGYFDLQLYKNVSMNILPDEHTKDMTSWFPAFFPLAEVVEVRAGDKIEFTIARRVDYNLRRVWYVWGLREPTITPIQNAVPYHWMSM